MQSNKKAASYYFSTSIPTPPVLSFDLNIYSLQKKDITYYEVTIFLHFTQYSAKYQLYRSNLFQIYKIIFHNTLFQYSKSKNFKKECRQSFSDCLHSFLWNSFQRQKTINCTFLEVGNTDMITRFLLKNKGISFLPEYVVHDYLKDGQLTILDTGCNEIIMQSQLVYHRNKYVTPQINLFIGFRSIRAEKHSKESLLCQSLLSA